MTSFCKIIWTSSRRLYSSANLSVIFSMHEWMMSIPAFSSCMLVLQYRFVQNITLHIITIIMSTFLQRQNKKSWDSLHRRTGVGVKRLHSPCSLNWAWCSQNFYSRSTKPTRHPSQVMTAVLPQTHSRLDSLLISTYTMISSTDVIHRMMWTTGENRLEKLQMTATIRNWNMLIAY